jgi:hypothetical protein
MFAWVYRFINSFGNLRPRESDGGLQPGINNEVLR